LNKRILLAVLFVACALPLSAQTAYPLKASANSRYLVDQNNVPFMIVGDSAWAMMPQLTPSQMATYFATRAAQGFNTVMVPITYPHTGTSGPTASGAAQDGTHPFTTGTTYATYDLSTPNSAYFAEVDAMINLAKTYGIMIMLNPMDNYTFLVQSGSGGTMQINGATKTFNYGAYLGNRYKNFTNVIWFPGNDFQDWNTNSTDNNLALQLMNGIKSADTNHLMSVELNYNFSYSNQDTTLAPDLTLDMAYTYGDTYAEVVSAFNSSPTTPVFMGEANYEGEDDTGGLHAPATAFVIRKQNYWTMNSGATGFLYGAAHVYTFDASWATAINDPGAGQIKYLNALYTLYPWWRLVADTGNSIVTSGGGTCNGNSNLNINTSNCSKTAYLTDGSLALVYSPGNNNPPGTFTFTVNMAKFSQPVYAAWYDPSNGTYARVSGTQPFTNSGSKTFTNPTTNSEGTYDFMLVLQTTPPWVNYHGCQAGMTCHYIDWTNGNDSNAGTSEGSPWKSAPGMTCASGNPAAYTLSASDALIFKGGEHWPFSCLSGTWNIPSGSGTGTPMANNFPGLALTYDPTWNDGTVQSVVIDEPGSNCSVLNVSISRAPGDTTGTGATATASIGTNFVVGDAMFVTVTNAGSNYTQNPIVSFTGTCSRFPKAHAFITMPVIDGSAGTFGTSSTVPPMFTPRGAYTVIDGMEFGHYAFQSNYTGGISPTMIGMFGGNNQYFDNGYVHDFGQAGAAQAQNSTTDGAQAAIIQAQDQGSVYNSYLTNWEIWANHGCATGSPPPCTTNTMVYQAHTFVGNHMWAFRGGVYTKSGSSGHLVAGNRVWGCLNSTGTQHPDALYLQGGGLTYNNILSDLYGGCASFYVENNDGANPVAVGNQNYLFNNVAYHLGTSTPGIGYSAEFTSGSATSVSPLVDSRAYNNTIEGMPIAASIPYTYAQGDCINSGQWSGTSDTMDVGSFPYGFTLNNNFCISDLATATRSWEAVGFGAPCPSDGCGTWNGNRSPNGSTAQTVLNNDNPQITTATAASQGYSVASYYAPQNTGAASVTYSSNPNSFNGSSLCTTSLNGLSMAALCSDILGNPRPGSGGWQAGAYWLNGGPPPASTPTFTPSVAAFGPTPLQSQSQPISITMQNNGSVTYNASSWGLNNARYFIQSNTCGTPASFIFGTTATGFSLAASASCTFQVVYTPLAVNPVDAGGVTFVDNTSGGSSPLSFSGNGFKPPVNLTQFQ